MVQVPSPHRQRHIALRKQLLAPARTLSPQEKRSTRAAGNVGYDAPAIAEGYLAVQWIQRTPRPRIAQTVTVTADTWYETKLLSIVGITAIPVHATARAELVRSSNSCETAP